MSFIRIVLVQPRNPLNILAAARAARNFGLGDIVVVDVQPAAWDEALHKDVDRETPHGPRGSGRGWLRDARKFDTLIEAIGDCDWVLGTCSLDRRRLGEFEVIDLRDLAGLIRATRFATEGGRVEVGAGAGSGFGAIGPADLVSDAGSMMSPDAGGAPLLARLGSTRDGAAPRIPNSESRTPTRESRTPDSPPGTTRHAPLAAPARRRLAILFGSEKRGLTNEHLMRCHQLLTIPTVDALPSMNLGQAVAVVCYELSRGGVLAGAGSLESGVPPAGQGALAEEVAGATVRGALAKVRGIVKPGSEFSEESGVAGDSTDAESSEGAPEAKFAADSAGSAGAKVPAAAKFAESAGGSAAAESSKLTEYKKEFEEVNVAANAAEIQALVDQVSALLKGNSVSSDNHLKKSGIDTRHRNLVKMLTRLPLTSEDVRRILSLVRAARTASAE